MSSTQLASVLRHLRGGPASTASDRELLERFCARRDESAFAQLLRRHGPMVIGVSRRVLRQEADAEDVFQATFLLLARKAPAIRQRDSVGSWLHGVAYHLALKARAREARRKAHERRAAQMRKTATVEAAWQELQEVLDQALQALPEHHRAVLLLCHLEGKTQEEAARQLGCPLGTVRSRLARGRKLLQARLARRGLALSAAALVTALAANGAGAALPARLLKPTLEAAVRFATGDAATPVISAKVTALAEGGLKTMFVNKAKVLAALVLAVGLLAGGVGALAQQFVSGPPRSEEPRPAAKPADAPAAERPGDPLPDGAAARLGTVRLRHGARVSAVSFSPDGKQLVSGDMDHTLRLWDAATGKKLFEADRKDGGGYAVAFSPDGKMVAAAGLDSIVHVWDATSWKVKLYQLKAPGEFFFSVAFSADSKALAAGTAGGAVLLWDLTTGQAAGRLEGHKGVVRCLAFSPDGKTLASGCDDKTARLWDVAAAKELHQFKGHAGVVSSVLFTRDGKALASGAGGIDEPLRVWDVSTGKELRQIKGNRNGFLHLAFSPDGKTLIAGEYSSLASWDWATGKELRRYGADEVARGLGGPIALTADGKTLAAVESETVRLWATDTGKEVLPSAGHRAEVRSVAFSPDGRTLASGGMDTAFCLWDAATGKELRRLGPFLASAPAFSPDGRLLAAGTIDGKVRFWDAATGKESPPALEPKGSILVVAFFPDGKSLVAGARDGTAGVWDLATRKEVRRFGGGSARTVSLAVSRDGKLLACGGDDGTIQTWDVAAGKELRRWQGHEGLVGASGTSSVRALAFSPDGQTLASGGADATVRLWDVAKGKELARLQGHRGPVQAVAFSPNGRMLASGGWDRTVGLWEVVTLEQRRRFQGHQGAVQAVAFSPDGKALASGSSDTTVLVWDAVGRPRTGESVKLTAEDGKALWADLASNDGERAYAAVGKLTAAPARAVAVVQAGLRPVPAADPKRLARLLGDLDAEAFETRDRAAKELEELGDAAEPYLRQALKGKPTAQVRRTTELLLAGLEGRTERVRAARALEVLEYAGTAEAKKLLGELAKGAPEAWLTRESQSILERLAPRPAR